MPIEMNEAQYLKYLTSMSSSKLSELSWRWQIENHILWTVCCEAVDSEDTDRLDRWRLGIDKSTKVIGKFQDNHVSSAYGYLDSAMIGLAAKGWAKRDFADENAREDRLVAVWNSVVSALGQECGSADDPGHLFFSGIAQQLLSSQADDQGEASAPVVCVDRLFHLLCGKLRESVRADTLLLAKAAWMWDATRSFLGKPRQSRRAREIPVAAAEGDNGTVSTLVLELVEPGCGQTFHDPRDAFHTSVNDVGNHFLRSLQFAWESARSLASKDGVELGQWDGRCRLRKGWSKDPNKKAEDIPLPIAHGASASAAAARGWYHALTDTVYDDQLIIISQIVDDEGNLAGVKASDIPAKVSAIVRNGTFDTIVVASDEDARKARETLPSGSSLIVRNLHVPISP